MQDEDDLSQHDSEPFEFPLFPSASLATGFLDNLFKKNDEPSGKLNHIYFTDDIDKESALSLCKKIKSISIQLKELQLRYDLEYPPKIYLHLNSHGGCIFSAFMVIDTILQSDIPIVSIIEGSCASATTLISIAAHERHMNEYAYFLIHQLRGGSWGKMHELEDEFENYQEITRRIKQHYQRFSKSPSLTDRLDDILKHDIWWTAKDCLEYGLIDHILTGSPEQIGNCINLQKKPQLNEE